MIIVPPIFIDTSSISEQFFLDQSQVNQLLDFTIKEITYRFAEQWRYEAGRVLKAARQEYINSIVVVDEGMAAGAVVLIGWLPNALENAVEGFDMKPGLLNGPNAKEGKNGKYNTVPFSPGTPGSLSSNVLPQEVYEIVKAKSTNIPLSGGGMASKGLTLQELPSQYQERQVKTITTPQSKSIKEYQHKNSIYEGVRKVKDGVTGQNSYQSFRRVSENSDVNSWFHPGFQGNEASGLSSKTLEQFDIPSETARAIDQFLSNL